MLAVTARAYRDVVVLTISHYGGDDLNILDLVVQASDNNGTMENATLAPALGTFSVGGTITATYTYGPSPTGKAITVYIIHVPSKQKLFSYPSVIVQAGSPLALLALTAHASGNNVVLTIEHDGGDYLSIADLTVQGINENGVMVTATISQSGTFSIGMTIIATYAYGANPSGKVITVYVIHNPTGQRMFSSASVLVEAGSPLTNLSISPEYFTLYPGENKTFIATLRDKNNNALANKTINWSATAGTLSASSGTTNSSGWISVTYTAPQVTSETPVTVTAYFMGDSQYQPSVGYSFGTITVNNVTARWSPRCGHTSVVFDNKMWVMGGASSTFHYYMNDVWYSSDGVNWTQATASAGWSARYSHTSVVFDNKMWVIGGHTSTSPYNNNDVWYSSDGVNWTQATASAGWGARCCHTSVVFDNKMWVMGGSGNTSINNDVWYSSDGVNWTQATASAGWSARYSHTSVVFDNKMWVIGGSGSTFPGSKSDVWYSSDGVNWTQATASAGWGARIYHTSVVFDGKMWVIGGYSNGDKNDVWYSSDGVNWTQATASAGWGARCCHTSVVYDGKTWVIGGLQDISGVKNDVWYSTNGVDWTQTTAVPSHSATLSISPSTFTLYPGENKTFIATLRDENNSALANKTINWSATAGRLSASSGTTSSYGQVTVTYTAPTVTTQTQVTITASFAGDNQYQASTRYSYGTITTVTQHAPLSINGNGQFDNAHGVTSGSGTAGNPYIIENWVISASSANGIYIKNTTAYFIIRNCLVENGHRGTCDGIRLDNVVNGRIENNTCENNWSGIFVNSSSNNILTNNTYRNNDLAGIELKSSDYNTLINNTCESTDQFIGIYNPFYGICIVQSSYNTLINNTCRNNQFGISLSGSSYNTLANNTCRNNHYGISIGNEHVFTLPYPYSTTQTTIIIPSSNNTITLNYLLDNTENNAGDDGTNYWDKDGKGNYWSDWQSPDNNGDGIVDVPRPIAGGGNNVDHYPLVITIRPATVLAITPSSFTLYPGENKKFIVTLRDENNNALANKTIIWNATAGSLSASSGTTNSSGWISVVYTAPQVTSQTAVTVSAYFIGDSQYQASYDSSEGTVLPQSSTQPTSLSIFPQYFVLFPSYSGQVQSLVVTLRDSNNNPIPNKTITCSATSGSINPSSGTTDALGQFSAVYTAPTVTAGTSVTITMSFAGDGQYSSSSATSSGIAATQVTEKILALTGGNVTINIIGTDVTLNVLAVPSNSLRENTSITVLQMPPENLATHTMMSNIFDIGPNGTNFTNPVTLTLPYQLPAGVSEDDLAIYYYNTDSNSWERVGGNVNKVDKTVSVQVDHLSKYAVMAELATAPQVGGGIPLIAVILAVLCVSAAAAASSAWIYLRRTRGEATSELIEHGLSNMKIQEVDMFRKIRSRKEFTIPELMQKTGASMTVVWRTVQKLIKKGLVQPTKKTIAPAAGRGKPSTVYKYVGD
jgi:parallel beta-helix repeat protein